MKFRCVVLALLLFVRLPAVADSADPSGGVIAQAVAFRQHGEVQKSIDLLTSVVDAKGSPAVQAEVAGELGISLLQARRLAPAAEYLQQAYAASAGVRRARHALSLGNLAVIGKRPDEARRYYREAAELAADDRDLRLSVGLNLVRLAPEGQKLAQLSALSKQLATAGADGDSGRLHLNLGDQARRLGPLGDALAFAHIHKADALAQQSADTRLRIEALDALAQLYEDRGRGPDALALTRQASALAQAAERGGVADLLIQLEWRQGRLLKAAGKPSQALAAYQRAVAQIETVRQDIPIEYEDGRSSFRETLEPVYSGYADLLLQQADGQPPEMRAARLRQAINTIELIRQSELQDFLGDRCAVEAVQGEGAAGIPAGTAVLYPLILAERVELLLETASGIERRTSRVGARTLRSVAGKLADALRNGTPNHLEPAQALHRWLLEPFAARLAAEKVRSLVVVPDGVLRLVPIAALHDGKEFAVEKFAVSMVTGMSLTHTAAPAGRDVASLVVGMSVPGPVVEKLGLLAAAGQREAGTPREVAAGGLARTRALRSSRSLTSAAAASAAGAAARSPIELLRESLALPGVKREVQELGRILGGTTMLDAAFTVDGFRGEAATGEYRVLHIASHGVFGGSAAESYIMAYDDVLTLDGLQSLLKSEKFRRSPIELLSLSACETADGNERSPLGISGAAIKARARSVLGTLWPVDDEAAQKVMEKFYGDLTVAQASKAEALRQGQLALVRSKDQSHPFFWAPFVLIGNWR